jgi:hypothetical protein
MRDGRTGGEPMCVVLANDAPDEAKVILSIAVLRVNVERRHRRDNDFERVRLPDTLERSPGLPSSTKKP